MLDMGVRDSWVGLGADSNGDSQPGQGNGWLHPLVTPVPDYTQAYMLGEKAF